MTKPKTRYATLATLWTSPRTRTPVCWMSSTVWWRGLSSPRICAQRGRPSSGKKVPGDEEERRQHRADHVVVVDPVREARDHDPEARPAEPGEEADERDGEHAQPGRARTRARRTTGSSRTLARAADHSISAVTSSSVSTGAGEDRVVGVLELVLDECPEHRRERAREEHCGRDGAGADELDVLVAPDRRDQRAEPEAERQQVDGRLDRRREGRGAPVGGSS